MDETLLPIIFIIILSVIMILWARHSGGGAPKISKKTVPTAHSDVDRQSRLKKTFDNILNKNLFERIIYFVIFLLVYTLLVFNGLGEYIKYLMKGFGLVERIIDGRDVIENILWLAFEIIIKLFPFYVLLKLFGHKKDPNHPSTQDKPTTE